MNIEFFRVGGFPSPHVFIDRSERWPHPRTVSNLLDVDDAANFPLLDSRTRYWRYYLVHRSGDGRQDRRSLGKLLHNVLRANDPRRVHDLDSRRLRGVGRGLYERKRNLGPRGELKVADNFKSAYGTAVGRFWERVEASNSSRIFDQAGARWRRSPRGFFDPDAQRDGHARNAFHRLIKDQSPVAKQFANLLLKDESGNDLWALASARAGWSSFETSEARRVYLARCLPMVLFKQPASAGSFEDEDADDQREAAPQQTTDWLGPIAETCLRFLTHKRVDTIRGRLNDAQVSELKVRLKAALNRSRFEEPYPAPARRPGQLLERLFPGHRLLAFHRMLHDTK